VPMMMMIMIRRYLVSHCFYTLDKFFNLNWIYNFVNINVYKIVSSTPIHSFVNMECFYNWFILIIIYYCICNCWLVPAVFAWEHHKMFEYLNVNNYLWRILYPAAVLCDWMWNKITNYLLPGYHSVVMASRTSIFLCSLPVSIRHIASCIRHFFYNAWLFLNPGNEAIDGCGSKTLNCCCAPKQRVGDMIHTCSRPR
jgi:hypothetical protein